ncbi:hypothetical protein POM88_039278 [Heracleum sosnowskyi]|uniref:MYB transcription factor n=1 Tax=Heracleum sosnowskyi TaxID=360622 RepID=A0AAD8HCT6_9APIA|nr:hypothetical protein POM88_039278 [Heracleum sosnowskyi]
MALGRRQWSAEEEAALKDGVTKYGVGKWRTILNDPDFSTALKVRSNVDLKDKWRNLNFRKSEGRISYKPVQENFKKTSRRHNKSAALLALATLAIAQPEASAIIHKSSEDGDSDKKTVMRQQSPQTIKVYMRRHKMHQQSQQTVKVVNLSQVVSEHYLWPPHKGLTTPDLKTFLWGNIKTVPSDGKLNVTNLFMAGKVN